MAFGAIVIAWYHLHKRDLPWRRTTDPYKIWLSEIILQQTRVDQGLAYYLRFVKKYTDVKKLAAAKEDDVLKLWQGLGYYSRARNMHAASKDVVKRFGGKFPSIYQDILSLKGVGEYTAAAIASFAYKKKYAVVDGNVYRVLSRYLGIKTPVDSSPAKIEFYGAALSLMGDLPPADFNQSIMEFGALQCTPQRPLCTGCPLNNSCYAFGKNKVDALPVKAKKQKVRNRYFNYLLIDHGKNIHLRKRTGSDIWKNLYDFPLVETTQKISSAKLFRHEEWKKYFSETSYLVVAESEIVKHQLSHQTIYARFFEVEASAPIRIAGTTSVDRKHAEKFAVPRLIENYLKAYRSV
jgi:A/G-specific adenine glycosylase